MCSFNNGTKSKEILYVDSNDVKRGENGDFEGYNDDDDDDDEMFDDAREVTLAGEVCERQAS